MSFLTLIFKNILRHRIRTILTILGISIGIATIIVFGLISSGLEDAIGGILRPGKADFTVVKAGSADIVLSFLDADKVEKIRNIEGVEEIIPFVFTITPVGSNPYFIVGGLDVDQLDMFGLKVIEGSAYSNNDEVIIGKIVARNKNLGVGDRIELNKKNYKITGIFESGISYYDSGSATTIEEAQRLQGITDKVNLVSVVVSEDYDIREVADRVDASDDELTAVVDVADYEAVDQGAKITNNITLAISILAVVIGAFGVMNTIIMSVFERTREIGVLRAVGWHRRRIVFMIIGESMLIGILAGVVGSLIGVGIIWFLGTTELGQAWLAVRYEPIIFVRALLVSLGVVLFGSIYPAFRAARLRPTEALKYE